MSNSVQPHGQQPTRLLCLWDSPGKNTGVGCLALLQEIFPIQESNLCLLGLLHLQAGSLPLVPPRKPYGWIEGTYSIQFSSVAQLSLTLQPYGLEQSRPPCPSPTPRVYSNSCPLSRWCHTTILSSIIPFSSHLQSFPESGCFHMSQFFASGGQSIGVSASASVLPMNIQDWFPLGWTSWISLQSKGLSKVFSKYAKDFDCMDHKKKKTNKQKKKNCVKLL